MLFRYSYGDGTYWVVGGTNTVLATCDHGRYLYLSSGAIRGTQGDTPTAPGYNTGHNWSGKEGWQDLDSDCDANCGIGIVANEGGGGR